MKSLNREKGFVLFFAVILVSVVLTISLSLFNITYKQIILSAVGRGSQVANFAAAGVMNCVLYWDNSGLSTYTPGDTEAMINASTPFGVFYTDETGSIPNFANPGRPEIECANQTIDLTAAGVRTDDSSNNKYITNFTVNNNSEKWCAKVLITKFRDPSLVIPQPSPAATFIVSGYNTGACNAIGPRTVERTLYTEK